MPKHAPRNVMTTSFALVGALALSLTGGTAHASGSLEYVALGDSYSAGSGVLPVDPTNLLCLRSTVNYPHVIASRTGAHLKDVTCGAAQTKDFTSSQYPGVAPQVNALDADTDLVTLTIGGNDNGTFINAITACGSAGLLTPRQGQPLQGPARLLLHRRDREEHLPRAEERPAGRTRQGAQRPRGRAGLPVDHTGPGRPVVLREAAGRRR